MNGETLRIFANPRFFEEYDARATARLKRSLEDRLTLLQRSVERLEHLRLAAEAVEELDLVQEIDSYRDLARANISTLEALIREVTDRHAECTSRVEAPGAALPAMPVFVPPAPALEAPAAAEPAVAAPQVETAALYTPPPVFEEPAPAAPEPEPAPSPPADVPSPSWPLPSWPLPAYATPPPLSGSPATAAASTAGTGDKEPTVAASAVPAPTDASPRTPPEVPANPAEDWSDLTARVSMQFGGDPLAGLVEERYTSPWAPATPEPAPAPKPQAEWDLEFDGGEEALSVDKVPTEKLFPESAHSLELEVRAGNRTFGWTMSRDSALVGRRSPDNRTRPDIDLWPDQAVSRRHLQISARDGRYYLMDLGSVNGTEVNAQWIEPKVEVELRAGDEIILGEHSRIRVRNLS